MRWFFRVLLFIFFGQLSNFVQTIEVSTIALKRAFLLLVQVIVLDGLEYVGLEVAR